jgi:hypothetical protein
MKSAPCWLDMFARGPDRTHTDVADNVDVVAVEVR